MQPRHRHDLPGARPGRRAHRRREHLPRPRARRGRASSAAAGRRARRRARCSRRLGHAEIPPRREVGTLSAAGKQIVSMARALSHDARLIVMDEPSAVLDARRGRQPLPGHPRPDRRRASPSSTSRTGSRRSARSATGSPCSRTAAPSPPACRPRSHPDPRADPADDRPHHRVRRSRRRPAPRPTGAELLQVEGLALAGEFADVSLHRARRRDRRPRRAGRLRPLRDPRDHLRRPPARRRAR